MASPGRANSAENAATGARASTSSRRLAKNCTGRDRRSRPATTAAGPAPPVLGVPIYVGTPDTATDVIVRAARDRSGGYACLCNVHLMVTAQRDQDVMRALTESLIVFPDGAPIAWLMTAPRPLGGISRVRAGHDGAGAGGRRLG